VSQSGHTFMALADKFIALGLGQRRILLRNRVILVSIDTLLVNRVSLNNGIQH